MALTETAIADEDTFTLSMHEGVRKVRGNAVDQKVFEWKGLRFETEDNEKPGLPSVTVRVFQGSDKLHEQLCDRFRLFKPYPDRPEIKVEWSIGPLGKTYGDFYLLPGWRLGGTHQHEPDSLV